MDGMKRISSQLPTFDAQLLHAPARVRHERDVREDRRADEDQQAARRSHGRFALHALPVGDPPHGPLREEHPGACAAPSPPRRGTFEAPWTSSSASGSSACRAPTARWTRRRWATSARRWTSSWESSSPSPTPRTRTATTSSRGRCRGPLRSALTMGRVPGGDGDKVVAVDYMGNIGRNAAEISEGAKVGINLPGNVAFWAEQQQIYSTVDGSQYRVSRQQSIRIDGDGDPPCPGGHAERRRGEDQRCQRPGPRAHRPGGGRPGARIHRAPSDLGRGPGRRNGAAGPGDPCPGEQPSAAQHVPERARVRRIRYSTW